MQRFVSADAVDERSQVSLRAARRLISTQHFACVQEAAVTRIAAAAAAAAARAYGCDGGCRMSAALCSLSAR